MTRSLQRPDFSVLFDSKQSDTALSAAGGGSFFYLTLSYKEVEMIDKAQLCAKIVEIYPEIGTCGIDVDVAFDQDQQRWVVNLEKAQHHLKTFLEEGDAELCLMGKQCVSLGIEITQLRDSIERYPG
jgi:hypothetical protein